MTAIDKQRFNEILLFAILNVFILFLFRDVQSAAVSMVELVCPTRKKKPFHVPARHRGLEPNVKFIKLVYNIAIIYHSIFHRR